MADFLSNLAPWPNTDFAEFGEMEIKPLSRVQYYVSSSLTRNSIFIPHVTHCDDIDVTVIEEKRKRWNQLNPEGRLTLLPLLMKAIVKVLIIYPQFNASLDADAKNIIFKKYYNIGVAVDCPQGLLVPVIRDCDKKTEIDIQKEVAEIADKAKTKGLSLSEMSGGCFTISSLGHIGGTVFTPIINAPEVAILGVTKTQNRAVLDTLGNVVWKKMLPLSLSYDHRVINGADAARFIVAVSDAMDSLEVFNGI